MMFNDHLDKIVGQPVELAKEIVEFYGFHWQVIDADSGECKARGWIFPRPEVHLEVDSGGRVVRYSVRS
jgi:hypothetical protein